MAFEPRELVKLSTGLVLSVAAARYLWNWYISRETQAVLALEKAPTATKPKPVKIDGQDADFYIYFGSQSGTAEGFSNELQQEAADHDLKATVVDMEDFDPDVFMNHKIVVLVVATYGEGDPTDNATEFFQWLQDDEHPRDVLDGMQYCVMGLGNRQYVHFNSCGKVADAKMESLSAGRIYERGEGDDDQNIEEDFEQWKENGLWPALLKACGKERVANGEKSAKHSMQEIVSGLPLTMELHEDLKKLPVDPLVQVGGSDILGKWFFQAKHCKVVNEYELRQVVDAEAGKTTKHLDFDIKDNPSLDWRTADNFEVLPSNPDETVEWFAERFGVKDKLDDYVGFARAKGVERPVKKPFPTPCSLKDALGWYCDLLQAPNKRDAKKLGVFIADEQERVAFETLLEDRQSYQWLTGEGVRLTFQELLELYMSSLKMDIGTFLQICPRQKNRPYTIASSSREDKHTVGICVSVVAEELKSIAAILKKMEKKGHSASGSAKYIAKVGAEAAQKARPFRGSCSTMLCTRVTKGQRLWVNSRPSSFRLPRKSTTPIIMIGAGTGIAPFRAYVQEFTAEAGVRKNTILFFGCQKRDVDYLYRDELAEALEKSPKVLGELVTAFSREQKDKVYVQHRLRERGDELAAMIKEGGYIYVCGANAMGQSIREELTTVLGGADYVTRLQTEGRYVEELW